MSSDSMLRCAYPDGTDCACFYSMLLTPLNGWMCDQPAKSANPKCTDQPPNAGTRCDLGPSNMVGPGCNYGCGMLGTTFLVATCSADATWVWSERSCTQTN
jgi:hypothetical protein